MLTSQMRQDSLDSFACFSPQSDLDLLFKDATPLVTRSVAPQPDDLLDAFLNQTFPQEMSTPEQAQLELPTFSDVSSMPSMDDLTIGSPAESADWRSVVYPSDFAIEGVLDMGVFNQNIKSRFYPTEEAYLDPHLISPSRQIPFDFQTGEGSSWSSMGSGLSSNVFANTRPRSSSNASSTDTLVDNLPHLGHRRRSVSQSHIQMESPMLSAISPRMRSATVSASLSPLSPVYEPMSPQSPSRPRSRSASSSNSKSRKVFHCHLCPSTFSRNHDLKRHVRIHLGIRPFKCETCPKAFTRADALHRHVHIRGCQGTDEEE